MSTVQGSFRHANRAIDATAERLWRAIGLRRLINWLVRALGEEP